MYATYMWKQQSEQAKHSGAIPYNGLLLYQNEISSQTTYYDLLEPNS